MLSKQTYNVLSERTMPCRPPLCIKASYNKWKNERMKVRVVNRPEGLSLRRIAFDRKESLKQGSDTNVNNKGSENFPFISNK